MNEEVHFGAPTVASGADRPSRAIFAFTRKERKMLAALKPGGRDAGLVFGSVKLTAWPDLILAGPILGAPQAAMVMEMLSRRGVRGYLSLGWCGSLQPSLTWGRIVLAETALSEEGTSSHYPLPDGGSGGADPELAGRLAQALTERGREFVRGRVWSIDAPYRETRDKIDAFAAGGILAVDMETSALMTVAAFRGLAYAGLLVVSDEVWGDKWNPGFGSPELEAGLSEAAEAILAVWA
ncbi:MAG: nucleoside phosphorylase [Proteobacteria bacterium]|nr:nucleoside phosphorylase [Pseudomonadota bacterium]